MGGLVRRGVLIWGCTFVERIIHMSNFTSEMGYKNIIQWLKEEHGSFGV